MIGWNFFIYFLHEIILSAIKDYFFGKKNLKENLAFISKIFDRKIFFWGIDCRIVIG
jgi:hypothetical protein